MNRSYADPGIYSLKSGDMQLNRVLALVALIFLGQTTFAQSLFYSSNFEEAQKKLTRTNNGKPGLHYWQNRGDYDIKVNFDPATNILNGEETIQYTNSSPDSLKRLLIRLFPDYYKKGVIRSGNISEKDLSEGVTIEGLTIGEENISSFSNKNKAFHSNTNLIVLPREPVLPHTHIKLTVKWHYTVNTGSQLRTGRVDSGSYFIAYFFPRIAVYDDMDGWDDWNYNGIQEFYNDFGNFKVEISLPKKYVVWATGERDNASDNFSSAVLQKLREAGHSERIIRVIDSADYLQGSVFTENATGKWKFSATDVSDFAFALSDHYLWDASSVMVDSVTKRNTLVSAAFNKTHADYFDVADQAHRSVFYMSHFYPKWPFPFPQITVFDGTDQMEYPMMVNDNPTETHKDAVQLTSHEVFHSYFPFYMGINETQYAWMDEGWATIGESVISPMMGEPEDEGIYSKGRYERISGTDKDLPLITNTKLYEAGAYLSNSYGKGGLCYWVLQDMLGDKIFFNALHQYMQDWHGRHPTPYDFFFSFNRAVGKDLGWFWKKWFFEWVYPDLGITGVATQNGLTKITIANKGGLPVPVYLAINTGEGQTKNIHYGAEVWAKDQKELVIQQRFQGKVISVTLGNAYTPDKYREDNQWGFK